MRALVFDLSIPKYLAAQAVDGVLAPVPTLRQQLGRHLHYGPGTCCHLRDVAEPTPPDASWALVAPQRVGLCGTDLATIYFKLSPVLSAVSSTPCTLGHEIFARLVGSPTLRTDACGRPLPEGARVVVDPFISCAVRGVDAAFACSSCRAGNYSTCERAGVGPRRGVMLGSSTDFPGGFAARTLAHGSQVFSVEDRIRDDVVASLVEPLSVGLQAVSSFAPRKGRALVIGAGAIGLAVVWALDRIAPGVEVTVLSRYDFQRNHASRLGAERVLETPARGEVLEALALEVGSPLLRPVLGRPLLASGYDAVFDCVGTSRSLDDALRCTRPRGEVVLVGCAGVVPQVDLTFVWSRELTIHGTVAYTSCLDLEGQRRRTFDVAIELAGSDEARLRPLVTHAVPLDRYAEALAVATDRRENRAVKVQLLPQA